MKKYIEKADVLVEALPYIQRFRGECIVVKFGGSAMENRDHARGILTDVTFMECVGMRPVLVHGGGKAISRRLKDEGIPTRFQHGLRVTCERSMQVVQAVMNEDLNAGLVADLRAMGARAEPVHGEDVFTAVKKLAVDPETGKEFDLGLVGEPVSLDVKPLRELIERDIIPVVTPIGRGADGLLYNMNADVAAAAVARFMQARKLAFLSDVPGLLRDAADPDSLIATLKAGEVEWLVKKGIIDGGMLPKVSSAVEALHAGVRKVHMIDGRMPHSLLLEIFTDKGVGTEIVRDE